MERIINITELQDIADKVVKNHEFPRELTDSERYRKEQELGELKAKFDRIEAEFKAIAEQYKAQMKPISETMKEYSKVISQNYQLVEEDCYLVIDHAEGMAGYYSCFTGELVSEREASPAELESTSNIFKIKAKKFA